MPKSTPADIAAAYFPGSHSEDEAWVRAEFQAAGRFVSNSTSDR